MKLSLVIQALVTTLIAGSGVLEAAEVTGPETNAPVAPDGWLQLPSHEVVLDVRHKYFEFGARQDSCEFVAAVINTLLQANYTVYFSDDFIKQEINYYREYLNQELPVELSKGILNRLEKSRASGVLDWDCFKGDFIRGVQNATKQRHLPWMAPPLNTKAIKFAGASPENLACLHLTLKWTSRNYALRNTPGGRGACRAKPSLCRGKVRLGLLKPSCS